MRTGHLALILHAHLPFVRHPEHDDFLEEDWLFEAIAETYIPLVAMMQRLVRERVRFQLTMTVTATLGAMLQDELLIGRFVRYLDQSIDLARREIERNQNHETLRGLAEFYHQRFLECRRLFVGEWNCDLIAQLRALRETGALELIASAASHGLLPLLAQSPQAVRAQILIGRDRHREMFGLDPAGFWLPECAFIPSLEKILQEANLRWFVLDAHGLMFGTPRPRRAIYAPCFTPAGPAAFARDRESSRQVWSAEEGYPGDPAYREFYRDIGLEMPLRKFTGLKYFRVTGREGEKEFYNREWALNVAEAHATDFLESRRQQFRELGALNFDPIVLVPFDAELFGHWWFEGPRFLELFIRKVASAENNFCLTTPIAYLEKYPTQQTIEPAPSSWGDKGYWGVWLDEKNSWVYPHLHSAALRLTKLARNYENSASDFSERVLKQLTRELLLAQASDWAFLMHSGTARHYATKRTTDHLLRFNRLFDQFAQNEVDEDFLANCEWRDNLFRDVDWRYYI